jgi:Uma2 family endonuclease
MATVPPPSALAEIEYPTTDFKPMAETEIHLDITVEARELVTAWYEDDSNTYVGCDLIVCYQEGNPRKFLSPDVFVVRGVPKRPRRQNYLIWKEGKAPEWALEITSKKTAKKDLNEKMRIYQDIWKVQEYFLFDPRDEYLSPALQGYHLRGKRFVRIRPVAGRLPSEILGLHLERDGQHLRFWNPATGEWLKTAREKYILAEAARQQAEAARQQETHARQQAEAEVERLRQELALLRQRPSKNHST